MHSLKQVLVDIFMKRTLFLSILSTLFFHLNAYAEITFQSPLSVDNWMDQTSSVLASKTIGSTILPGTHDTGTYAITMQSRIAPDLDPKLKSLIEITGPLGKKIIKNWSVTQNLNITGQLNAGIRYLDLRLCKMNQNVPTEEEQISTCHGLEGASFQSILNQVNDFLAQPNHQKEIVILDINHIYGYPAGDSLQKLKEEVLDTLGNRLFTPTSALNTPLAELHFADLWNQQKNVIVLISDTDFSDSFDHGIFWGAHEISSPWPNIQPTATDYGVGALLQKMKDFLDERDTQKVFVLQTQETADTQTIVNSLIKRKTPQSILQMTGLYKPSVQSWLNSEQGLGLVKVHGNIIIEDFSNGYDLTQYAIQLNAMNSSLFQ